MNDKKKIIIGALCALIMVMAVGYALLSQQLSINGSASITSNWQVEITNITEKEKSTGTTTNNTNYTATTASFNTSLTSPGDYALYEVTVTNKGTLDAILSAEPTVTTGNNTAITYELEGIKKGDKILKNNQTDTFTIKVQYNPATTTQPTTLTSTIEVTLNYEQDLGQVVTGFNGTGTIYRYYTGENSGQTQTLLLNQNIEDYLSDDSYKGEWSTDPGDFNSIYYLKHEVSNYVITASYVCFIADNTEHCVQGGGKDSQGPSYYQDNVLVLQGVQSWFTSNGGSCSINASGNSSYCRDADFSDVNTNSDAYAGDINDCFRVNTYLSGDVDAGDGDGYCAVDYQGTSECYRE